MGQRPDNWNILFFFLSLMCIWQCCVWLVFVFVHVRCIDKTLTRNSSWSLAMAIAAATTTNINRNRTEPEKRRCLQSYFFNSIVLAHKVLFFRAMNLFDELICKGICYVVDFRQLLLLAHFWERIVRNAMMRSVIKFGEYSIGSISAGFSVVRF